MSEPPRRRRTDPRALGVKGADAAEPTPRAQEPDRPSAARPEGPAAQTVPADAAFAAQLLSGGPRRGLKGGPETLTAARATYLGAEFSGPQDRRPPKGRIAKKEV